MVLNTKNCYAEDVLKTSSRHVFKTSSRRLQDQQMLLGDDDITDKMNNMILTEKQQKYRDWHQVKNEFYTGKEILPSDQSRLTQLSSFTCYPLRKHLKNRKTIEEQGKKQVETLELLKSDIQNFTIKDVIPENIVTEEAKHELNKTKEIEKTVPRGNLVYRTNEYT